MAAAFPKTFESLTALYHKYGVNSSLLFSVADINQRQPSRAVEIVRQFLGGLNGKKIAVLGLTFKAGTDDVRESVAILIVSELVSSGASVSVYDPKGMENARQLLHESVKYAQNAISCIKSAECCIIATEWDEFRNIPTSTFKKEMRNAMIIDGRRVLDVDACEREGVAVYGLGRYSRNETTERGLKISTSVKK